MTGWAIQGGYGSLNMADQNDSEERETEQESSGASNTPWGRLSWRNSHNSSRVVRRSFERCRRQGRRPAASREKTNTLVKRRLQHSCGHNSKRNFARSPGCRQCPLLAHRAFRSQGGSRVRLAISRLWRRGNRRGPSARSECRPVTHAYQNRAATPGTSARSTAIRRALRQPGPRAGACIAAGA